MLSFVSQLSKAMHIFKSDHPGCTTPCLTCTLAPLFWCKGPVAWQAGLVLVNLLLNLCLHVCLPPTEYEKYKEAADTANARKEQLFEEAKDLGGVGDRKADSKLHALEQRLEVRAARLLHACMCKACIMLAASACEAICSSHAAVRLHPVAS